MLTREASAFQLKQMMRMREDPNVYGPNGIKYSNKDADMDFSKIGISIVKEVGKDVEECRSGFYATTHISGKTKDGKVVIDTRATKMGNPIRFKVGYHEVLECWDLAMTKLKSG
jgi:FKBP-type peptidyl-prolyl cis-trans isomerase